MSFCKTEVSKESQDGIESIYQSKIDSSLNSDSKIKEGVCYFLKSRLPTAEGTVNSRKVEVLRNTVCTCCTVKRSLVSDDQLIGTESYVTLIDEMIGILWRLLILAVRFSLENLRLCAWKIHCMILCWEILMDQNFLICLIFLQPQLLVLKLSKTKMLIGNLRFLIR